MTDDQRCDARKLIIISLKKKKKDSIIKDGWPNRALTITR